MEHTETVRDFRAHLAQVIRAAEDEGRVTVVTRHGQSVGAFVPAYMLEKLEEWEDEQLAQRALAAEAADDASAPGLSLSEMFAEIVGEAAPDDRHHAA
ncbi:type II toxin-antitoxin system Phd/YefM family antitoxin [Streptomyces polyrhachis]|uniref:Antitoxin n=1 Tax=Streptomyces polyrhachis TaxID=1282885 RepID=A0ABW2GFM9_9ACTN